MHGEEFKEWWGTVFVVVQDLQFYAEQINQKVYELFTIGGDSMTSQRPVAVTLEILLLIINSIK